jgi:hypothetical protein
MKQHTPASSSTDLSSRCRHYTVDGRRCRLRVLDPRSGLCFRHAQLQEAHSASDGDQDLSALLTAGLTDFKSAVPINNFLSRLLLHQAEGRIPPRRAAVMAYTCNLLLRTLPAIDHELGIKEKPEPPRIEFSYFPRPLLERINAAKAPGDASGESVDPGKKSS